MTLHDLNIPDQAIRDFCIKWNIAELSLFGSILRTDFKPDSDVDVLVAFAHPAAGSYWDWADMTDELARIFSRPVHLVERRSVVNPFIRHRVLTTRQVVYAA